MYMTWELGKLETYYLHHQYFQVGHTGPLDIDVHILLLKHEFLIYDISIR